MVSKDRSKSKSAAGSKTTKGQVGTRSNSLSKEHRAIEDQEQQASKAKTKAQPTPASSRKPKTPPSTNQQPVATQKKAQLKSSSAAAEADHKPLPPGIDAMAILEQAEVEQNTTDTITKPSAPATPPSAAKVIARMTARDHPEVESTTRPRPQTKPRRAPEAKPTLKRSAPPEPSKPPVGGIGAEGLPPPMVADDQVAALLNADLSDPFSFLGMHKAENGKALTVRVFIPDAASVTVLDVVSGKEVAKLHKVHDEGLYAGEIKDYSQPFRYRLKITNDHGIEEIEDPYGFPPVLPNQAIKQLCAGNNLTSYNVLGAHPAEIEGVQGVTFAVWAPNANHVSVVGDFNDWDGRRHSMRRRHECGVWEIFLPNVSNGARYKYEIKSTTGGAPMFKSDPYAFATEGAPEFASIVHELNGFSWRDHIWMKERSQRHVPNAPLAFYEVHLGSWRRKPEENSRYLSYNELAKELVEYVSEMGFTHIALQPVSEYHHEDTLGYLPSDLYAPTSRYGTPNDLRHLIDACHRAGIGVVADWVPNLISEDPQGLAMFDGTALYQHPDPQQGRDLDWNRPTYNYARHEVADYLIGNALYWIDQFHIDGLRIEGLAKMLYLDYGRSDGEWTPNKDGGNDNLDALAFIRRFNESITKHYPGVMTIAEDSSLRRDLTKPVREGGLGFSYRWNTAWAYDTLRYLNRHPVHRKYYQFELTNPLIHAFNEQFILPVSHDHFSFGQGSIINKLPGDRWQKFATLRAWYALMYTLPAKKLMFMGIEFAQEREWNSNISLDWHLLGDDMHLGVQRLVRDLNQLYRDKEVLHELDSESTGFEWIDFSDEDNSVIAFVRPSSDWKKLMVVITHFTPVLRYEYRIGVPADGRYKVVLNTDAEAYGGGNQGIGNEAIAEPHPAHGHGYSLLLTLPPYSTTLLELSRG